MNSDQLLALVAKENKRITQYVYDRLQSEWYPVTLEKDLGFVEREVKEVDKLFDDNKIYEIIKPQYERVLVQRHERHIAKLNQSMGQRQIPALTFSECIQLILSEHFSNKDAYAVRAEPAIDFIVTERKNREERWGSLIKRAERRIGHFFRSISSRDSLHIENLVKASDLKKIDDVIVQDVFNNFEKHREKDEAVLIVEVNNSLAELGAEPVKFFEQLDLMGHVYDYEQSGTNVWDGTRGEHYAKYLINQRIAKDKPHPSKNIVSQGVLVDGVHKEILPEPGYFAVIGHESVAKLPFISPDENHVAKANPENWAVRPMLESADHEPAEIEAKWSSAEGVSFEGYRRTVTTFSGADALVVLNGNIIGEVQNIVWNEDFQSGDDPRVSGYVDVVMFETDGFKNALVENLQDTKLCVVFSNEYGQQAWTQFIDPVFSDMDTEISVDMILQMARYNFTAEDTKMERLHEPTHVTLDDGSTNPLFC